MFIRRTENNWLTKWWLGVDKIVLFSVLALIIFGIVIQFAASPYQARRMGLGDEYHFIKNVFIYLWLGLGVILVVSNIKLQVIRKFTMTVAYPISFIAMFATLFFSKTKGASRWINFGAMKIQPSEFLKPFFAIVVAMILVRIKDLHKKIKEEKSLTEIKNLKMRRNHYILLLMFGILLPVCGVLMAQPDFGMTFTFIFVFLSEVFVAGLPWKILFLLGGMVVGLLPFAYKYFPHFLTRVNKFLMNDNYQLDKALDAIKESNILLGGHANNLKTIVPDIHTDFIFAAVIEEMGPVLALLLILVFLILVMHILYSLKSKKDSFVILSGIGVVSYLTFQIMYNLISTLGIGPTKGMTLPFISYGGSSFISSCLAIGIILSLLQDQNLRR